VNKFRVLIVVCALAIGALSTAPSFAAVRTGGSCAPAKRVLVEAGVKYTCVKTGARTVWGSGVHCKIPGDISLIAGKRYLCEQTSSRNILTESQYLWVDEFNDKIGTAPSSSKWTPVYGTGWPLIGWGNNELESYEDYANRMDGNGSLVITASRSKSLNSATSGVMSQWVSGKITTSATVNFQYGKLEARIKVPSGAGTWPAFWMLGDRYPNVPWPWSGEIDILEGKGSQPSKIWQTAHGPAGGGAKASLPTSNVFNTGVNLFSDYHTYGIQWKPDQLQWTFDGNVISTATKNQWDAISDADWPFNRPFYAILNLAMGGDFAGGVSGSISQAQMKVDWVHYSEFSGFGKVIKKK